MPCLAENISSDQQDRTPRKGKKKRKRIETPVPMISREDELSCIKLYRQNRSRRERNEVFQKLYDAYDMLLVHNLIHRWKVSNINLKDGIEYSVAVMAFIDALDRFDVEAGFRFSTFLTHHMNHHMTRHMAGYASGVNRYAEDLNGSDVDYTEDDVEGNFISGAMERSASPEKQCEREQRMFEYLDEEEKWDDKLLETMSPQVVFALKNFTGMYDNRLGRYHVFRLIGTNFRSDISELLSTYNFLIMMVIRAIDEQPGSFDEAFDTCQ